jgi:hypothetical protein
MKVTAIAFSVLLVAFVCPFVNAEDGVSSSNEWEFIFAPYVWGASLDGDATVRGLESDVDIGFDDLLEDLELAWQMHLEARKGKWGAFVDTIYMALSDEVDVGPFDVDADVEFALIEFAGLYRVGEWSLGNSDGRAIALDAFAGGRWTYVKPQVDIEGQLGYVERRLEQSKDWMDLMVGARTRLDLTDKLSVVTKADIGGFGIGSSSDFTWNIYTLLGYELSECVTLYGGYRYLDQDYDSGSGRNELEYDMRTHGPMIGAAFRF